MPVDSVHALHFGQNERLPVCNLYHLKALAEYYPNIHSAPFNPASADFCIVIITYVLT